MKFRVYIPLFILILMSLLTLAACQSDAPPTETPQAPTIEPTRVVEEQPAVGTVVSIAQNADLGSYLVDENGMSLYVFVNDTPGTSSCTDDCAENWPPLLTEGAPVAGENVDASLLGSTIRSDGGMQITYDDKPLYYWINDSQAGDINGQGVGDVWFVVSPDGETVMPAAVIPSVSVMDQEIVNNMVTILEVVSDGAGWLVIHAELEGKPGPILGFAPVGDGVNNEVDVGIDAENATEILFAMLHMDGGEIGNFEFPDGPDTPVAVDETIVMPTFEVPAKAVSDPSGEFNILLGGNDELGPFLTDADGMTLYFYANDEPGISNCYDQCAVNWPPLLFEDAQTPVGSGDLPAEFETIERTDGTKQATYKSWPLYYWINDAATGDTTGHGVNGVWAVTGVEPAVFSIIPGESEVAYEVGETFLGENRFSTAVGVTTLVEGKIMGDLTNPRSVVLGPVAVDISQFQSDSSRRDNTIRSDFLESAQYPIATFTPIEIEGIPGEYTTGDPVNLLISGDLAIKETTQTVIFEVSTQLDADTLMGEATTMILMSDFGIGPISILGMLETEDEVLLDFNFVARP